MTEDLTIGKNKKHNVGDLGAEEPFLDERHFIFKDHIHSQNEERFRILGRTQSERLLLVVFTLRLGKIRIISVRDVNKSEAKLYEERIKNT